MFLKYFTSYDYDCIGKLVFSDEKLIVVFENKEKGIDLKNNSIKLLYKGIRKRGFHYGRDYPRSGIFEIIINDLEQMKKILNIMV